MPRTVFSAGLLLLCLGLAVSVAAQDAPAPATSAQAPAADEKSKAPEGPAEPVSPGARIQNFNETKEANPPDMVCFGYGPKWSVQFINGEARYLGVNQPDQYFLGDFYWVADEKAWEWHRANNLAPMNGEFALSATIQKESCQDPVRKQTYPYSAQVNLPQGDMVSGCCRKLKPGEAPVGRHGLQQTAPTPNVPAPTGSATEQGSSGSSGSEPSSTPQQQSHKPKAGVPQVQ